MFDFLKNTMCQFGYWIEPLVFQNEDLSQFVSEHAVFNAENKLHYKEWRQQAHENYAQIDKQLNTEYGLPELEMLRIESCFCIIQGHWQGVVCLTNILLEAFLKLALVYSNTGKSNENEPPLHRILNSLSEPTKKYMGMSLNDTIDTAYEHRLINETMKNILHEYRKRFRNAFFHADMKQMFGDQTTSVSALDFNSFDTEGPSEIPIHSVPFLLGEALWQNAYANAIPFFRQVDELIRNTLPKVFPNFKNDQSKNCMEK